MFCCFCWVLFKIKVTMIIVKLDDIEYYKKYLLTVKKRQGIVTLM